MSTKRKRIIKVKKKNLIIFLFILIALSFSVIKTTNLIVNLITKTKSSEKTNTKDNTINKKLEQLENIDKEIDYFNKDYIDRYINYKDKNPELSTIQVIKNVNMNLDLKHYKDIFKAKNLNKETILVNKYYYLDEKYIPDNLENVSTNYAVKGMKLVKKAKEAFEKLSEDAKKEDLNIVAMSTYRSYSYQVNLYNRYANTDGKEAADTYSGRAGHSEHQTGLAIDVYNKTTLYTNFETTEEYKWMQKHAHEYGFILRFPKGKENETGYQYESWHYRYVGKNIAKYIHDNNITLEEYYATKIKDW